MSRFMQTTALVGALAATAFAHGRVAKITADGTEYPGWANEYVHGAPIPDGLAAWSGTTGDSGFVDGSSYNSAADMACHAGGKPGPAVATVAAGSSITFEWGPEVWPASHHGPVIDYMAHCADDDCTSVSATDLSFFKIAEAGLVDGASAPGKWASDDLIAAGGVWEVTVPESLAPGQYVIRHEIISLHESGQTDKSQHYPQCYNLEVTGSGSASPSGVTADKLYTASDDGILFNIYEDDLSYDIPGPALWDGASSGGSGAGSSGGSAGGSENDSLSEGDSPADEDTPELDTESSSEAPSAPESYPVHTPKYPAGNSSAPAASTGLASAGPTGSPSAPDAPFPTAMAIKPSATKAHSSPAVNPVDTESADDSSSAPANTSGKAEEQPTKSYDDATSSPDGSSPCITGKPLPEDITVEDLLAYLHYFVEKGSETDRLHARDFSRRR